LESKLVSQQLVHDSLDHDSPLVSGIFLVCFAPGKMTKRYLVEWDVSAVPHCFVINKQGLVTWHGHPHSVEQALQESFDAEKDAEYLMVEKQSETPRDEQESTDGKAAVTSPNVASC
jgi:hypothetical protein